MRWYKFKNWWETKLLTYINLEKVRKGFWTPTNQNERHYGVIEKTWNSGKPEELPHTSSSRRSQMTPEQSLRLCRPQLISVLMNQQWERVCGKSSKAKKHCSRISTQRLSYIYWTASWRFVRYLTKKLCWMTRKTFWIEGVCPLM